MDFTNEFDVSGLFGSQQDSFAHLLSEFGLTEEEFGTIMETVVEVVTRAKTIKETVGALRDVFSETEYAFVGGVMSGAIILTIVSMLREREEEEEDSDDEYFF